MQRRRHPPLQLPRSGATSAPHKLRAIPDVEQQWYQAPGGDYRADLYGEQLSGVRPRNRGPSPVRRGRGRLRDPQPADARQHRRLPAEQPDLRGGQRLAARPLARPRQHRTGSAAPSASTPRTSGARSPRSSGWPTTRRWCRSVFRCSRANRTASRCSSRSGKPPPRTACRWPCTSTAATASTMRPPSPATPTPTRATPRSCR